MAAGAGAVRAGGAFVEIFAKDGQFQQAMTRVQNKLKAVGTAMRQMGTNLSIGGAALGAPFVIAAREAANFTLQMAQVRANTKATEDQFAKLTAAARQMGIEMGQSPTDVANAMNELAKAGLDANGVMASIGPVLALAAADNMELARAVEVVIGTMSQFGLTTNDFGSISDRLQAAANASVTSVDLIGESLSYVGPQAQAAGQGLDDVLAAMGALAQGGIRGSMAGTQMARVLEAMTSEEQKFNDLGISVRDSTGNLRPFMDVIRELGAATAGMSNADRLQAFMDIFDIRGARAAITLSSLGGEFDRIMAEIQGSAGAATTKAAQVLDSFGGAAKRLAAMFSDLKIAVITSMGETATATVRGLGAALQIVTRFVEKNPQLTATMAAVAGGMLTLGAAAIAGGIALQVMGRGISVVMGLLRIIPAMFTPVGAAATVAFAAIAAGVVIARQLSPAFRRETDGIMAAIMQMDFGAAWEIMNLNFAIALTQMAASASNTLATVRGFFAAAGAYIGDMLTEGLDRFMGIFGADIITLQSLLEKIGIYFRAAFDWRFAATGMRAALQAAEDGAARARAASPTAGSRAAARASGRQASADARQADMDRAASGYADTVDELRQELDRVHARLKPKPEEKRAAAGAAVPGRPDMGVMPVGSGAAGSAAAGAGIGRTLGTFGAGEGLGIGPELNVLEDSSKQTAENTGRIAGILSQGAVGGSPAAAALAGAPRAVAAPSIGIPAAGAVAAPAAAAIAGRADGVQAGMDQVSVLRSLSQITSDGFRALIAEAVAHRKVSERHTGKFDRLIQAVEKGGAVFA